MSRTILLVVAMLVGPHVTGQALAQLTPPAGSAGAGMAPISGVPYGPANPRALSDPSGIGNAASVPPLRSNTPVITVPQAPLAPAHVAAPPNYPYASQQVYSGQAVEPKSKPSRQRRDHRQDNSFTGICRGC